VQFVPTQNQRTNNNQQKQNSDQRTTEPILSISDILARRSRSSRLPTPTSNAELGGLENRSLIVNEVNQRRSLGIHGESNVKFILQDGDASGRNYANFEAISSSTARLTTSFVHPEPKSFLINSGETFALINRLPEGQRKELTLLGWMPIWMLQLANFFNVWKVLCGPCAISTS
jgi:hypothetical protein